MLGMHGTKAANLIVQECDLLIAVGARFDDRVTGKLDTFAPHAKVIHVDIDAAEFNKLRHAHAALRGDINLILPQLELSHDISPWVHHSESLRSGFKWRYDHPGDNIFAPLLLKQLSDMMPDSSIVSTDVGQHQMWQRSTFSHAHHKTSSRPQAWHHGLWFTGSNGCCGRAS